MIALAHRHRRYGAGMIYLKLYAEAQLQVNRRKRKKIPRADRQPLARPQRANQIWSMDFVFDRTAERRVLKYLTIVDDADALTGHAGGPSWFAMSHAH